MFLKPQLVGWQEALTIQAKKDRTGKVVWIDLQHGGCRIWSQMAGFKIRLQSFISYFTVDELLLCISASSKMEIILQNFKVLQCS